MWISDGKCSAQPTLIATSCSSNISLREMLIFKSRPPKDDEHTEPIEIREDHPQPADVRTRMHRDGILDD